MKGTTTPAMIPIMRPIAFPRVLTACMWKEKVMMHA